jgi:hypothetical protein
VIDIEEIGHRVARSWIEKAAPDEVEEFFDLVYRARGLTRVTLAEAEAIDKELTNSGERIRELVGQALHDRPR